MAPLIHQIKRITCPAFDESRAFYSLDLGEILMRTCSMTEEDVLEDAPEGATTQALCLRVCADADPGALARILICFQTLNVVPRRVVAELETRETLRVRIDVTNLTEQQLSLIAAKVGQVPCVGNAYWDRI